MTGARAIRGRAVRSAPVLGLLLTVSLLPSACHRAEPTRPAAASGLGATTRYLAQPVAKPALRLTDTNGRPFDLRARTAGVVTLLYFGYTHCPDVCPTTMADIAQALRQVAVLRGKVDVVFVTTDPTRDTAPVIKSWLGHFDPTFIGLTGDQSAIYRAAAGVGVPLVAPKPKAGADYPVSHGAQVLAFGTDGRARLVFTAATSATDYAHDLVLLADGEV